MDVSVLVLASASVPLGLIALYDMVSGERSRGVFGVAAAAWSLSGVVFVHFGVPGVVFFPGLLLILIASALFKARGGGLRSQYAKAISLSALLALVTVGTVIL